MDVVYVGVKGSVIAVGRTDGKVRWKQKLAGRSFVNVAFDQGAVLAHTKGELFCLDPESGAVRWRNPLAGMGYGMVTMASPTLEGGKQQVAALAAYLQQKDNEAVASSATAASGSTSAV